MGNTNLDNLVLKDAETAATGRGNITAELALIKADLTALAALANELKTDFNAHTHRGDGAQAGAYNTSLPQSDTQTVTPVTASTVAAASVTVTTK